MCPPLDSIAFMRERDRQAAKDALLDVEPDEEPTASGGDGLPPHLGLLSDTLPVMPPSE